MTAESVSGPATALDKGPGLLGAHDLPLLTLLFAWLGSATAWAGHFGLVYLLDTLTCTVVLGSADLAIYLVTLVLAGVSAASGWVSWRGIRRLRSRPQPMGEAEAEPPGREGSLLLMGLAAAVLFTLLILLEGMVPAFLPACGEAVPR